MPSILSSNQPVDFGAINTNASVSMPSIASMANPPKAPTAQTSATPTVSYMANATQAGLPGAPAVNPTQAPTTQQIAQKYQNYHSTVQGTTAPPTNPSAKITAETQPAARRPHVLRIG